MDRLFFKRGKLNHFIKEVQTKLGMNSNQLAKLVGFSGRTIRDWRREKFNPSSTAILELSRRSGLPIPEHEVLSRYWYTVKAAKLGGRRTYEVHGLLGTKETRSKGGKNSWAKRRQNPELLKKYMNSITKPLESTDLAEFIGIMLGDGCLTTYQCTIYLNSETDQEYAKYVKNLIRKLFNLTPGIHKHKKWKMLKVSVSGMNLVEYLKQKGLYVGNKVLLQVAVPQWVWGKLEYKKACIRGLIDTDGCFALHKYKVNKKEYCYPKICFSNRSQPLLNFVYQGLKQFGFNPKKTYKYGVWLHSQNEVRRYLKEIGTRNLKPSVKKILGGVA